VDTDGRYQQEMHTLILFLPTGPPVETRGMRTRADTTVVDHDLLPDWRNDAACIEHAGRVNFFPARGESAHEAKAICAGCRAREECLEYALESKVAFGVWGGLSERERRQVRRERHRAARRLLGRH
jgi:WhiB family redox-sensing transcriptional regulator